MKLIIEISDNEYEYIMKEGFLEKKHGEMCYKAIKTAIPLEKCGDCISKSDTLNTILKYLCVKDEKYLLASERAIYNWIKDMPPIQPKQRTGEWIKDGDMFRCSSCGELSCCKGNYCTDCGAKMDVPDNNVGEMGGEQE